MNIGRAQNTRMIPGVSGILGNSMKGQGFLLSAGDSLGEVVKNTLAKIYDLIIQLYKNGLFMYIVLIVVGIAIYYILRYFIGLKLGRQQSEDRIKKQAQK